MFGRLKDFARSIRERSRRLRHNAAAIGARAATAIAGEIGRDEIYLASGLLLVAAGCWDTWRPGAFFVPGLALVWIAMPTRGAFVERPPQEPKKG